MDEKQAKHQCAQLAAEHPDRETHRWIPVQGRDGDWSVAKINLPPTATPTGTETRETKSESGDDPRVLPPWLDPPRGGLA